MQRCGGGSAHRVRAGVIARTNYQAIRCALALGADSRVGARRVTGGFRAALSPCRATMARMECVRRTDAGADLEFYFDTQSELPRNHQAEADLVVGRRDGLGSGRRDESMDFSRPIKSALARHLLRGCHNHRMAAWGPAARVGRRWQHDFVYRSCRGTGSPGGLGNYPGPIFGLLRISGHDSSDELRDEYRHIARGA